MLPCEELHASIAEAIEASAQKPGSAARAGGFGGAGRGCDLRLRELRTEARAGVDRNTIARWVRED